MAAIQRLVRFALSAPTRRRWATMASQRYPSRGAQNLPVPRQSPATSSTGKRAITALSSAPRCRWCPFAGKSTMPSSGGADEAGGRCDERCCCGRPRPSSAAYGQGPSATKPAEPPGECRQEHEPAEASVRGPPLRPLRGALGAGLPSLFCVNWTPVLLPLDAAADYRGELLTDEGACARRRSHLVLSSPQPTRGSDALGLMIERPTWQLAVNGDRYRRRGHDADRDDDAAGDERGLHAEVAASAGAKASGTSSGRVAVILSGSDHLPTKPWATRHAAECA